MSTPDPQQPSDPPADKPEESATVSFDKSSTPAAGIVLGWIGVATLVVTLLFLFTAAAVPSPYY